MGVIPVLALSVLLQYVAAFLALNLIRVTGRRRAWVLIALAILLMAIRRSITLYYAIAGDLVHPPDLSFELVALAISALMVAGIAHIAPIFKAAQEAGQFHQIMDQVGEAILLIDPETGQLTDCNETACANLGYRRHELLSRHISDIVVDRRDESPAEWRDRISSIKEAGTTFLSEGLHQRKDGSTFPVEVSIAYRPFGENSCLVAIARNITERKAVEESLYKAQQDRENLINSVDGIVWEVDVCTFSFTFVSQQAERILGYPIERWIDDPNFWVDHIHEEDREWAVQFCQQETQALKDHQFEYRMVAADDRVVWLHDIVSVIVEGGEATKLRGLMIDITERKHLEAELDRQTWELSKTSNMLQEQGQLLQSFRKIREMTLSSLDIEQVLDTVGQEIIKVGIFRSLMIALVDDENQWVQVERNFVCKNRNGRPIPGEVGIPAASTVGTRYALDDDNITAEVVRTGQMQVIGGHDKRFDPRYNDPGHWTKISYFIPVKKGDRVLAVFATGSEAEDKEAMLHRIEIMQPLLNEVAIALEHARLYQKLQDSEMQLRQAQKMEAIGQLSAGIAHNFNNMLMGIMGNLHLAQLEASPTQRSYLADADISTQKATEMVRQLLAYSRQERPHEYQPVDLTSVLGETVGICRQTIDRQIAIEVELEENAPPVSGDASQLDQMLMNLCLNARDALVEKGTPHPTIRIALATVSLSNDDLPSPLARPGRFARIEVSDNGIGMDETTRSRIFDPFFTTKPVDQGTGLGLSTVYGILKQHDGWIDCQSAPGEGTVFSAYLPTTSPLSVVSQDSVARDELVGGTETILVIDDEEIVRQVAVAILDKLGYEPLAAATGLQGLSLYRQHQDRVDLVLLDLNLTDRPGSEIYAELRALSPDLPIVLFTGYAESQTLPPGDEVPIIEKPITLERLSRSVRDALAGSTQLSD